MHPPRRLIAVIGLVGIAATTALIASPAAADSSCAGLTTSVLQSVNPDSAQSLLTTSEQEATIAADVWNFTEQRGPVFDASATAQDGLVPVYRFVKDDRFVWIPEKRGSNEIERAQSVFGWSQKKIEFWASATPLDCGIGVHRMWNTDLQTFRMETDQKRIDDLLASGWRDNGIRFWVARHEVEHPPTAPVPAPAPDPTPAPTHPGDGDGRFTMAIIPDTQQEVFGSARFAQRNQWLVDNKEELDLRYAIHTGDLSNWGETDPVQYERASAAMKVLDDGGVPSAIAIGNHDTGAVCAGGSACPGKNPSVTVRETSGFNATFPASRYPAITTVFEPGRVDNQVQTFEAEGVKFLVLTLELWPREEVVQWAKDVVASHPDHNVIINTHSYLEGDGSIMRNDGGYGATSPQYLFDELVSQYANVKMVFSGHVGMSNQRTDIGVHGNRIASFLGGFHSPSNPVKLVEVNVDEGTLSAQVFVPQTETHESQYDVTIDGIDFIE